MIISREEPSKDTDPVPEHLKAVSELYEAYYRVGGNETERRIRIEEALGRLMNAWDKMLG